MRHPTLIALASALLATSACGSSSDTAPPDAGDGGSTTTTSTGGTADEGGFNPGTGGGASEACSEEAKAIYVLAQGDPPTIHAFDPQMQSFTPKVDVVCPDTTGWAVTSMSIDRDARAWLQWGSPTGDDYIKRIDRLDLETGTCQPGIGQAPTSAPDHASLGMAFVTAGPQSPHESLYFIDKSTFVHRVGQSSPVGQFYVFGPGEGTEFSGAELTGTGEGRLFTMIMNWTPEWDHPCTPNDPCYPTVHLGEVSTANGSTISNEEVPDVDALGLTPGGFAFAHWGARFWLFVSRNFGPTEVYEYDHENVTTTRHADGPSAIVGAGVSTCAPVEPPK